MHQGLKLKYIELQESDPTKDAPKDEYYPAEGYIRNVTFIELNGNETFLNYGNLIRGYYFIEKGSIILTFSSDVITLEGMNLKIMFREFARSLPRQIVCQDARYNAVAEKNKPIVNKMEIKATGNR